MAADFRSWLLGHRDGRHPEEASHRLGEAIDAGINDRDVAPSYGKAGDPAVLSAHTKQLAVVGSHGATTAFLAAFSKFDD